MLGPPGWDHAKVAPHPVPSAGAGRLARWYDDFAAAGYGRSLAGDPTTQAIAELHLVAATLMCDCGPTAPTPRP